MKFVTISIVSLTALLCASCSTPQSANAPLKTGEPPIAKDSTTSKPDMKAMFGPDYQKGDIGHSTGMVTSVDTDKGLITIDHGILHGTSIVAGASTFETLPSAKSAIVSAGDKIEFLVKKGSDGTYRLLKICAIAKDEAGCL